MHACMHYIAQTDCPISGSQANKLASSVVTMTPKLKRVGVNSRCSPYARLQPDLAHCQTVSSDDGSWMDFIADELIRSL